MNTELQQLILVLQHLEDVQNKIIPRWAPRDKQKEPLSDWFIWLILAGRGFGKTRTGAETVKKWVQSNRYKRICLLGYSFDEVRNVMVEGESGLLNVCHDFVPNYFATRRLLIWPNGAQAELHSSEAYDKLRGPQFDAAWVDELTKFKYLNETWEQLMMTLRLGNNPKILITTTPRPIKLLQELICNPKVHCTYGSTFENSNNLSKNFVQMIQQYEGTMFGEQELHGKIVTHDNFALWHAHNILYWSKALPKFRMVIIGVDPSVSDNKNDEVGIIVVGKNMNDEYIVLHDGSGQMTFEQWQRRVRDLYKEFHAQEIIIEGNQGGDVYKNIFNELSTKIVYAHKNKRHRAIPISLLYAQKKVYHAYKFHALEQQMLEFHNLTHSPDRVDALVWAISGLQHVHYKLLL